MTGAGRESWLVCVAVLACAACGGEAACPEGTRRLGTRCAEFARDAGAGEDGDASGDDDASSVQAEGDAGDNGPPASDSGAEEEAGMEQPDSGPPQVPVTSPLLDLAVSAGTLNPAFSSAIIEYRVPVDVTVQTVTVTPKVPSGATAAIDGKAIDLASGWTSGVLKLGDTRVEIVVTHEGSAPSTYVLTVTRGFQQAYIKASNTGAGDAFGTSVAIAGDVLVVGAPYEDSAAYGINGSQEDDATALDSGAAYVFERLDGEWQQTRYLKATNTEAGDHFGASVAISSGFSGEVGQIIVVGAPGEDGGAVGANGDQSSNSAPDSGAAYVYGVGDGITYLKCGTMVVDPGDACGASVAVWHHWIALGAPGEDGAQTDISEQYDGNNAAVDSGAVFVYSCGRPNACGGRPNSYVKPNNTGAQDRFGQSVALSGVYPSAGAAAAPTAATLVVGAPGEDSWATGVGGDGSPNVNTSLDSGAAYVFLVGSALGQLAYLKPNHVGIGYAFGSSVAVSADVIVVGAPREPGSAVGVNGSTDKASAGSGAAYVYTKNVNTVTLAAYLKATNTGPQDLFGSSVAVSENVIVVGAPGEDSNARGVGGNQLDNTASNAGAAYTYEVKNAAWVPPAYFKPNSPAAQDGFGASVAISKGTIVVAAAGEDRAGTGIDSPAPADGTADASGAVYVFR